MWTNSQSWLLFCRHLFNKPMTWSSPFWEHLKFSAFRIVQGVSCFQFHQFSEQFFASTCARKFIAKMMILMFRTVFLLDIVKEFLKLILFNLMCVFCVSAKGQLDSEWIYKGHCSCQNPNQKLQRFLPWKSISG